MYSFARMYTCISKVPLQLKAAGLTVYEVLNTEAIWFRKMETHQTLNYPEPSLMKIHFYNLSSIFENMKPPLTFKDIFFHVTTK